MRNYRLSFNTSFDKDGWESLSQYVSKNEVLQVLVYVAKSNLTELLPISV